jgi:hypothetical protein
VNETFLKKLYRVDWSLRVAVDLDASKVIWTWKGGTDPGVEEKLNQIGWCRRSQSMNWNWKGGTK